VVPSTGGMLVKPGVVREAAKSGKEEEKEGEGKDF